MPPRHVYGGPWTVIKLDILEKYLSFYSTALKNQNFEKWYIDAFAGSGDFEIPGFDDISLRIDESHGQRAGSAKIALNQDPPFDHYIFIEKDSRRLSELKNTVQKFPSRSVDLVQGDANEHIKNICSSSIWPKRRRGVVFLDPYAMSVDWTTLKVLSNTKLDIWYLFPTGALVRQLARDYSKLDDHKRLAIDRILGTREWRSEFYRPKELEQNFLDVFHEDTEDKKIQRHVDVKQIRNYVHIQLKELFPYAHPPITLRYKNVGLFDLFLIVSNESESAINLAKKMGGHITRKHQ